VLLAGVALLNGSGVALDAVAINGSALAPSSCGGAGAIRFVDVCGGLSLVGNSTLLAANLTVVQGATPAASVASFDVIGATLRSRESFAVADGSAVRVTNASLVNCTVLRVSMVVMAVSAFVGMYNSSVVVVSLVDNAASYVVIIMAGTVGAVVVVSGGSTVSVIGCNSSSGGGVAAISIAASAARGGHTTDRGWVVAGGVRFLLHPDSAAAELFCRYELCFAHRERLSAGHGQCHEPNLRCELPRRGVA
jgi:hypothetical protein